MARIVVVDDDARLREIVRRVLERAGHQVKEASNGTEGTQLVREDPPDLLITDIVMPDKEGIATIVELRRDYPDLKIIAASGGGRFGVGPYLDSAKMFGANRTLTKPFGIDEIRQTVEELLAEASPSPCAGT